MVERYLLEQLSREDEVAFEEHLLGCARCLADLGEAEDLREALRTTVAADLARAAAGAGLLARLRRRGLLAWALALLLVLPLGALLWQNRQLAGDLERLAAPRSAALVTLAAVRDGGGEDPVQHVAPPASGWLVLAVELPFAEHAAYALELEDDRGRPLWAAEDLRPDAGGRLAVSLPAADLEPGDYALRLTGQEPGGRRVPAGRYPFRVR